jgi:hypothetical protein
MPSGCNVCNRHNSLALVACLFIYLLIVLFICFLVVTAVPFPRFASGLNNHGPHTGRGNDGPPTGRRIHGPPKGRRIHGPRTRRRIHGLTVRGPKPELNMDRKRA